jgi:HK97 gp10 family phage protein
METKIIGMRELYEALSTKIPQKMEGPVLQKALSAGATIVRRAVQQNLGRGGSFPDTDTGTLKRSVYQKRSKFNNSSTLQNRIVGIRHGKAAQKKGRDAYYASWVEFGHRGRVGSKVAGPPKWVAARPFMRPAFEATKDQALAAILDKLAEQLDVAKKGANW